MKKISIFILSALLLLGISSQVWAESSATGFTGKSYTENQVFVVGINESGSTISDNSVVILDLTAANVTTGTTLGIGVATTTTADSPYIIGVADEAIADGATGRICVRGPHEVYVTTLITNNGVNVGSTTTAGAAATTTQTATTKGTLGFTIGVDSSSIYKNWIWVNPHNQ